VKIAKNKYGHDFKAVISNFDLIDFNFNKTGILRDFCKKCGLSIEALDYQFSIEFNFIKTEVLKQEQLTFNPENIIDFYPVVKDYILPSEVLRPSYAEAESYFNQGHLQAATEKFKQVIILCHEINGPIHRISASCHKKLAYISYYEGNYHTAISLITKAIIIYEKLSEFDSPVVSTCYSELASYYLAIGETLNAFKAMFKSWEISMLTYPKNVS
jgi:tetratricopeptide (TPR) repeat protein